MYVVRQYNSRKYLIPFLLLFRFLVGKLCRGFDLIEHDSNTYGKVSEFYFTNKMYMSVFYTYLCWQRIKFYIPTKKNEVTDYCVFKVRL